MTMTRKERIERVAAQWWAAYIASPTQSPWTHNDCIAEASKFIDAIDALPDEPARAPDTTTIERERCAAVAKKHLCISGNKFAQDAARSILSEIINPSLDGPLNRQPDHIEEINKLVDDVFGIPDPNEKVDPKIYPGEAVYCDDNGNFVNKNGERLEKVELPGKWELLEPVDGRYGVGFGGIRVAGSDFADTDYAVEASDFVAAANKLRELTFAAAFRAGIEAATAIPIKGMSLEIIEQIRAIPTPSVD
jgi:hypothetical protein